MCVRGLGKRPVLKFTRPAWWVLTWQAHLLQRCWEYTPSAPNYILFRCHGVWHSTLKNSFLWLSLNWKFSWFAQDTKLNHTGKYTKVVIGFVFQGLKGTSRTGRTLKLFGEMKGRLLRSERKAQREEGRGTRHTFCPRGNFKWGWLPTQYRFKTKNRNTAPSSIALIYCTVSIVELVKIFKARVEKGDEICNYSVSCKSRHLFGHRS